MAIRYIWIQFDWNNMKFRCILLVIVIGWAFESRAQLDSAKTLPVPEHSHVLKINTLPEQNQLRHELLNSKRPLEVTELLNNLTVSPKKYLKSASKYLKLDSIVATEWTEEAQTIGNTEKVRFDVDDNENEMVLRYYSWNAENGRWKIDQANHYFFSSNGQLDSTEFQEYVVGTYRRYTQTLYSYENGLVSYTLRREKIDEIDIWEELDRTKYDYDSIGQLTNVYSQERDAFDNHWATHFYIEYTRDSLGNVVEETGYDYEDYDGISTRKYYLTYDYDNEDRLTTITEYVKGWQEGQFVQDRKQENLYDENAQLASEVYYNWNYDSNGWLEETRLVYDHTMIGKELQTVVSQDWDGQWLDNQKALYLTDHFYDISEIEYLDFFDALMPMYSFGNVVCDRIEKSVQQNNSWYDAGSTVYYFSNDGLTGIENQEISKVKIYPNPVTDILTIESGSQDITNCILYDLSGRVVQQTQISGRLTIDVSWLNSGFYLLEVRKSKEIVYSGKLIKK